MCSLFGGSRAPRSPKCNNSKCPVSTTRVNFQQLRPRLWWAGSRLPPPREQASPGKPSRSQGDAQGNAAPLGGAQDGQGSCCRDRQKADAPPGWGRGAWGGGGAGTEDDLPRAQPKPQGTADGHRGRHSLARSGSQREPALCTRHTGGRPPGKTNPTCGGRPTRQTCGRQITLELQCPGRRGPWRGPRTRESTRGALESADSGRAGGHKGGAEAASSLCEHPTWSATCPALALSRALWPCPGVGGQLADHWAWTCHRATGLPCLQRVMCCTLRMGRDSLPTGSQVSHVEISRLRGKQIARHDVGGPGPIRRRPSQTTD